MNDNSVKPISITDDWFITQSFIFPEYFSSSVNLSEELIHCVQFEQEEYDRLVQKYQQTIELLNQREQEMSERLIILREFYEKLMKINQTNSMKDLLNSSMWNHLHKMTDDLETLCSKMIHTNNQENLFIFTNNILNK
ncbi:hypothetical protein I4U23_014626 [Adineta vaga]|nr:hypothetical protein I4U23_014626 [Adineta vaga]